MRYPHSLAHCVRDAVTTSFPCHSQVSKPDAEDPRDIIEQGTPNDLVANFDKLFHDKIEETRTLARQAARAHGLLPEFF